jgi:hypothetical protein
LTQQKQELIDQADAALAKAVVARAKAEADWRTKAEADWRKSFWARTDLADAIEVDEPTR